MNPESVLICSLIPIMMSPEELNHIMCHLSEEDCERLYNNIETYEKCLKSKGVFFNNIEDYIENIAKGKR